MRFQIPHTPPPLSTIRCTSSMGIALICRFEGFSATPYRCPVGYWTIGYGHRLREETRAAGPHPSSLPLGEGSCRVTSAKLKAAGEGTWKSSSLNLTEEEAKALLSQDLAATERAIHRLLPVVLNQNQFDALISFTYNLGAGTLQRSTLRQKVLRGEHAAVPAELRRYVFAAGRKLPGLLRRRTAEAALYAGDKNAVIP